MRFHTGNKVIKDLKSGIALQRAQLHRNSYARFGKLKAWRRERHGSFSDRGNDSIPR